MSKTKEAVIDEQQEQAAVPAGSPTGNIATPQTLTAATPEALFQQVEDLRASVPEGKTLTTGAVGRNDQGQYVIQIDII